MGVISFEGLAEKTIGFLDKYIFPTGIYCIACGAIIDESRKYALCDRCMEEFCWSNKNTCEICGKPLIDCGNSHICSDCQDTKHYFDKGYSCFLYGDLEKKAIMDLKYFSKEWVARKFAIIMADRMQEAIAEQGGEVFFDLVLPIPIHKTRLNERGYNQAWLLAKYFAEKIGAIAREDVLVRTKKTKKMQGLSRMERLTNIEGAFEIPAAKTLEIEGKRILLIDDIYTTGSTADEAARLLKERGASEVYLLVLAAGAN